MIAESRPCPGSCNPAHTPPDDTTPGDPVWCTACQIHITSQIRRLPDLAAALWDRTITDDGRIAHAGRSDRTRRATRSGSPSGSPAWDVIDEIVTWAADLDDRLRSHLRHAAAGRPHWVGTTAARAETLRGAVRHLVTWAPDLLSGPLAVDAGREALGLARRAERAAGLDVLIHRLPAPCPRCDRVGLTREDGADRVWCAACGASWAEDAYRRLVHVLASERADTS